MLPLATRPSTTNFAGETASTYCSAPLTRPSFALPSRLQSERKHSPRTLHPHGVAVRVTEFRDCDHIRRADPFRAIDAPFEWLRPAEPGPLSILAGGSRPQARRQPEAGCHRSCVPPAGPPRFAAGGLSPALRSAAPCRGVAGPRFAGRASAARLRAPGGPPGPPRLRRGRGGRAGPGSPFVPLPKPTPCSRTLPVLGSCCCPVVPPSSAARRRSPAAAPPPRALSALNAGSWRRPCVQLRA